MSNNKKNNQKISIWSELSGASIGVGIGLLVIVILAVIFYIFMNLSPAKKVRVDDFAEIFSEQEESSLKELAENLSKEKDINVVVVTTRNKGDGYSNSDADCRKYAEDYYMRNVNTVPLQNNSGICILVDLTIDKDGQRFFWLYTYGTAHFAVSDDECSNLFYGNKELLGRGEYASALTNILVKLNQYSYKGYGAIIFTMIIPILGAWLITKLATPSRRLDPAPATSHYKISSPKAIDGEDKFLRKTVVKMESSSSGGGGGGGFSGGGGGGGGGFSGGGGGRF